MGNCLLQAISLFPTVFSSGFENFLPFSSNLKLSSANFFSSEESKLSFEKGIILYMVGLTILYFFFRYMNFLRKPEMERHSMIK